MVRLEDVPYRRRSGVTNQPWRRDVACEGERPGLQVDGDENSDRVPLAPAGDDQLKVGGTIAVTASPPIDPVAHAGASSSPRTPASASSTSLPRGIEVVDEPRRHRVEVSRPVGVERHPQR